MKQKELYSEIERLIIVWSNNGTKTAGSLTREIMGLLDNNENEEWCHYSDLPSPMAYTKRNDCDNVEE